MIAAGPFALYVPGRPELPRNADPNNIMVFGNKAKDKTHWFLCKNADELNLHVALIAPPHLRHTVQECPLPHAARLATRQGPSPIHSAYSDLSASGDHRQPR